MSKNDAPNTDIAGVELSTDVVRSAGDVRKAISDIQSGEVGIFSSLPADTFADKKVVLSHVTNSVSITEADLLGKPFKLAHFILQPVVMTDEKTQELSEVARVILVTDKGDAIHAMSGGLLKSLTNLTGLLGHPATWPEPLDVEVVERRSRNGYRFMTLNVL